MKFCETIIISILSLNFPHFGNYFGTVFVNELYLKQSKLNHDFMTAVAKLVELSLHPRDQGSVHDR